MPSTIPKRIIQTGRHVQQSLLNQAAIANLRLLNTDFDYEFFDDGRVLSFINCEFPEFRRVFDAFARPIQRYDFFRYLAVYRYGGFYFDLDVLLASGLSGLLTSGCVFPFERLTLSSHLRKCGMDWEVGNYAFGATPGHPFLAAIIENCVRAQREPGWAEPMMRGLPLFFRSEFLVLNTTGPGLVSRTLVEHPQLMSNVRILFPEDVCNPDNWHRFGDLGVHLMDGSWRTSGRFLRRKCTQYWTHWQMQRRLSESRQLGKARPVPACMTPSITS